LILFDSELILNLIDRDEDSTKTKIFARKIIKTAELPKSFSHIQCENNLLDDDREANAVVLA